VCEQQHEFERAGIPEAVIRRRFSAGLEHFHHRYKPAVDDWALYDNAGDAPVMLEWGENQ
jgi:predicted ABC-type ATPase